MDLNTNTLLALASLATMLLGFISFLVRLVESLQLLQQKDYLEVRVLAEPKNKNLDTIGALFLWAAVGWQSYLMLRLFEVSSGLITIAWVVTLLLTIVGVLLLVIRFLKRQFRRPQFTLRILLIGMVTWLIVFILSLFIFAPTTAALVSAALPIYFVLAANWLVKRVVFIFHRIKLRQAALLVGSLPKMQVIGITGSYGKSATKYFLNAILSEKYKVFSTPGSINTDIGIASYLLAHFKRKENYDFLILEMDTYVVGTLARIVKFFPLDFAIVTGINEQHLETFGGKVENTILGNYQMLPGLKNKNNTVVFSAESDLTAEVAHKFLVENKPDATNVFLVAREDRITKTAKELNLNYSSINLDLISAVTPVNKAESASIKYTWNKEQIQLPVLGEFNAVNYSLAARLATSLGLDSKDIKAAAAKVVLKDQTLKIYSQKKLELIDDSFSANPASVFGNLDLITSRQKDLPAKTLIVFPGLVDLSVASEKIHRELGEQLAKHDLTVLMTNSEYGVIVQKSFVSNKPKATLEIITEPAIQKHFIKNFTEGSESKRIIIIGRINSTLYKYILSLVKANTK